MRSICLFSSYSCSENIADYVRVYIEGLQNYFEKIVFVTNERELNNESAVWLKSREIEYMPVKNEGFDFGMWLKAIQKYDCSLYDRVALINDSCVLFKKLDKVFDWINSSALDYCGLVSSARYSYHIQSYFVVMNKSAFLLVHDYLIKTGIVENYWAVIQAYEIGMNQFLLKNGIRLGAMYESITLDCPENPSFYLLPQLIEAGMPMIKKKILFKSYRPGEYWGMILMNFNINEAFYIQLIKNHYNNKLLVNFENVIAEQGAKRRPFMLFSIRVAQKLVGFLKQFAIMRILYRWLVKIKRMLVGRL